MTTHSHTCLVSMTPALTQGQKNLVSEAAKLEKKKKTTFKWLKGFDVMRCSHCTPVHQAHSSNTLKPLCVPAARTAGALVPERTVRVVTFSWLPRVGGNKQTVSWSD